MRPAIPAARPFRLGVILAATFASQSLAAQQPLGAPWDSVARVLKAPGAVAEGVYRYSMPRRDLDVRIGDVAVAPALALGSWAGFAGAPENATVMGDLVVTTQELPAVLGELARQQITVTAVHNHLVGETPRIMYVHFHGRGSALDLAARLARVVARTGTPLPVVPGESPPVRIDTAVVFQVLGTRGRVLGNVAQMSFDLVPGAVMQHGARLPRPLAYRSPINIQMVNRTRAVATGDFAVLGERVAAVLDSLAAHGITATAVHNHLINEQPAIYYIHFWADGQLPSVLAGLRAAVDAAR